MKTPILAPYLFRDLADGIQQQMFFWGQDVLQPEGNFLVAQGFQRSPSTGIKGTSCYRRKWQGGEIELYGSCAGWYGSEGGFAFMRPQRRCVVWLSGEETPIPGEWSPDHLDTRASREKLYQASLPFLDWLIDYEHAVLAQFGAGYRERNYRKYKKVPKARAWLEPHEALRWFRTFRERPLLIERPKDIARRQHI